MRRPWLGVTLSALAAFTTAAGCGDSSDTDDGQQTGGDAPGGGSGTGGGDRGGNGAQDGGTGGTATGGGSDGTGGGSVVDPCEGLDCSGQGTCTVSGDAALCVCDDGWFSTGPDCVAALVAPTFTDPPTEVGAPLARPFQLALEVDPGTADTLAFAIDDETCSFSVSVTDSGVVGFECPTAEECEVTVTVSDAVNPEEGDRATFGVSCANTAPTFVDRTPADADELTVYNLELGCEDAEGDPLLLRRGDGDTCDGTVLDQGNGVGVYSFVPGEEAGGTTCLAAVECDDGLETTTAELPITVLEVNRQPGIGNVPDTRTVHSGEGSSFNASGTDADVPVQSLSWGVSDDCAGFDATNVANAVSFICGAPEECTITVTVTDDGSPAQSRSDTVTLTCENEPPAFTSVLPLPRVGLDWAVELACSDPDADDVTLAEGATLTCAGTLSDDGDGIGAWVSPPLGSLGDECVLDLSCNDPWAGTGSLTATVAVAEPWVSLSAGEQFACALRGGEAFCWGQNSDGQLGVDDLVQRVEPTAVATTLTFDTLSAGRVHACAIDDAGQLHCWGGNAQGELGLGDNGDGTERLVPTQVGTDDQWTAVEGGWNHTCGLSAGRLFCWGYNNNAQIGLGGTNPGRYLEPTQVGTDADWTAVSAGDQTTCGIRGGALYCWGRNGNGQIGQGATTPSRYTTPTLVSAVAGTWTHISVGQTHLCGINDGRLFCWGQQQYGRVGNGLYDAGNVVTPTQVGSDADWTAVEASNTHTCGIRAGQLFCWGRNNSAQLGIGTKGDVENAAAPVQVGAFAAWGSAAATGAFSCGTLGGNVFCWGRPSEGQLGDGTKKERRVPTLVVEP